MTALTLILSHRTVPARLAGTLLVVALMLAVAPVLAAQPTVAHGTLASLLAGSATAVGALLIYATTRISTRAQDGMLGFGAGVMLAATSFSLVVPAIDSAELLFGSRALAAGFAAGGMIAGALFLWAADRYVPHQHFVKGSEGADGRRVKRIWLFVFAIALHNLPEGLAVGVSFGAGNSADSIGLATGIGMQNMPEGLAVALALSLLGYSRTTAFLIASLTGLVEPVAGFFGAAVISLAQPLLPFALAFAAGAMLFVISHEIIPESHRRGHEQAATMGVVGGFVVMMLLDVALA
jgi:zinc transporter, ZIP family